MFVAWFRDEKRTQRPRGAAAKDSGGGHASLRAARRGVGHVRRHSRFVEAIKGKTTGLKQIEAIGRAYVKFQEECPDSFALFAANEARPHGKPSALLDRICFHGQATTNIVEETIRVGLRDGSIRPSIPRPEIHAFLLWAFTHGLAQFVAMRKETLKGERLDPAKVIEEGIRFLREGMAAR
jgi:hypothetical protein